MSYKVILPTYKRTECIVNKTLKTIKATNLDLSQVYVFTADEPGEYESYVEALKGFDCNIVKGVRGLPNQHNFIQDYFKEGVNLFILDDDVSEIGIYDEENKKSIPLLDLDGFVKRSFEITAALKKQCWGANSNCNPLVMQNKFSVGLIYIVQNMFGIINSHDRRTYVDTGDVIPLRKTFNAGKESHERVIKNYLTHGGVVKFKNVGAKGQYWVTKGGLEVSRTDEGEMQASQIFIKLYPDLVRYRDFNGRPDLQFIGGKTTVYPIDIDLNELTETKTIDLYNGLF